MTAVKAKVGKGTVKITWKAVPGATSYRVRISKPGGKNYKAWKSTTKRVFKATVKKGTKHRLQVTAVGAGGQGPPGEPKWVRPSRDTDLTRGYPRNNGAAM